MKCQIQLSKHCIHVCVTLLLLTKRAARLPALKKYSCQQFFIHKTSQYYHLLTAKYTYYWSMALPIGMVSLMNRQRKRKSNQCTFLRYESIQIIQPLNYAFLDSPAAYMVTWLHQSLAKNYSTNVGDGPARCFFVVQMDYQY